MYYLHFLHELHGEKRLFSVPSMPSVVKNRISFVPLCICAGIGFIVASSVPDGTGQIVQRVV